MLLEAIERRGEDRVVEVIEEMPLVESLRQVAFDVARLLDEEASAQNAAAAKMPIGGHRAKGEDSVEETLARMIMTAAGPDYADQAGDVPGAVRALMQEFGVRPVADAIRRVTVAFKGGAPRSYLERARADAPGDGDGKLDRP
ncbi:MAG: hypothetical protein ACRDMH_13060 [Solirubrobacterales bacterium]